jgi:hypothetical protein
MSRSLIKRYSQYRFIISESFGDNEMGEIFLGGGKWIWDWGLRIADLVSGWVGDWAVVVGSEQTELQNIYNFK